MARDRQRAKQRRDRARRSGAPRSATDRAARGGARAPIEPDDASPIEEDETLEAPEPLEHSSAEVDIAEAQVAMGRPELVEDEDEEEYADDELDDRGGTAADDELDAEADAAAGPRRRRRREAEEEVEDEEAETAIAGARPASVERPHAGGGRLGAFLLASWRELQRVQWPDRRQVVQATGVVLGFVIVAGLFLGVAGWLAARLVDFLV
jgi:preprotein translocase SecE subunit